MDNSTGILNEFNGRSMDEGCTGLKVQEGERHRCHAGLRSLNLRSLKSLFKLISENPCSSPSISASNEEIKNTKIKFI